MTAGKQIDAFLLQYDEEVLINASSSLLPVNLKCRNLTIFCQMANSN
jgi:hypothetical protein